MVILTLSFKIKRPLRSQKQSIFTGYTRTKFLLKETFHFPVKWYSFSQKMKLAPEFDHIKNSQFFILHMCDKLLDIFSSFWFSDERTYFFFLWIQVCLPARKGLRNHFFSHHWVVLFQAARMMEDFKKGSVIPQLVTVGVLTVTVLNCLELEPEEGLIVLLQVTLTYM